MGSARSPGLGMVGLREGATSGSMWVLWLAGWDAWQPVGCVHVSSFSWGSQHCGGPVTEGGDIKQQVKNQRDRWERDMEERKSLIF